MNIMLRAVKIQRIDGFPFHPLHNHLFIVTYREMSNLSDKRLNLSGSIGYYNQKQMKQML